MLSELKQSLELILFLENFEYLPRLTSGQGAVVVIHEPGTVPNIDGEGIFVSAGTQTLIGLKQICQKLCLQEQIHQKCKCYDSASPQENSIMKVASRLHPCETGTELICAAQTKSTFSQSEMSCTCPNPCRNNFIKLLIYYDDLNYETISEVPDYELFQLLSDVGGTIGLWIGLSLLSLFEVLQLLAEVVLFTVTHTFNL
ncbi:amiloride-sensitive sodium channel subunit gamma-2-like [Physella acuta]|uniref:amiloride-sensitive sodium channel subunit gamma-2-like n=1 Tax=Physella acuta TaxID=109671 RepID=UPI0027DB81FE|nr:amiloride-sensitive sodium channel subunit gamma-2-like [Physella acuta]